jgi:hypothetical protein
MKDTLIYVTKGFSPEELSSPTANTNSEVRTCEDRCVFAVTDHLHLPAGTETLSSRREYETVSFAAQA